MEEPIYVLWPKEVPYKEFSFAKYGFSDMNEVVGHIAYFYYCANGPEEDLVWMETLQDAIDGFFAF